jgi:hypothetical protein
MSDNLKIDGCSFHVFRDENGNMCGRLLVESRAARQLVHEMIDCIGEDDDSFPNWIVDGPITKNEYSDDIDLRRAFREVVSENIRNFGHQWIEQRPHLEKLLKR